MNNKKICGLCGINVANKTNSHIIPSFILSRVVNYDGSYKRGKEIIFNFHGLFVDASIGREIDESQVDRIFDNVTEDRLERLKETDVSIDYIFCIECEKKLSEYFESKYAAMLTHNVKIEMDVEYFFWMSVLWRIGKYMQTDIPVKVISMCHRSILSYMNFKESTGHAKLLYPLKYYVLYCPNYCKSHSAAIQIKYYAENGIILLLLGDLIIVFLTKGTRLPKKTKIFGLEYIIDRDIVNIGASNEKRQLMQATVLETIYADVINKEAEDYVFRVRKVIYELWPNIRKVRKTLPIFPDEKFIQSVFKHLAGDQIKIGEKFSENHLRRSLANAFNEIYSNV